MNTVPEEVNKMLSRQDRNSMFTGLLIGLCIGFGLGILGVLLTPKQVIHRPSFDAGVMHGASVLVQINASGVTNIDQRQFMDAAWWSYTNQGGVK